MLMIVTLSFYATKVSKGVLMDANRGILLGCAYPKHMIDIRTGADNVMDVFDAQFGTEAVRNQAAEIKAYIIMAQNPPPNKSPMEIITARLGTSNENCSDFDMMIIDMLGRSHQFNLINVCSDGLDT